MYSDTIKPEVDAIFRELAKRVSSVVKNTANADETVKQVTRLVSSELASQSKSILSDMLFSLSDELMETEFFSNIRRQNRFYEINLRQEILDKYQFSSTADVDYRENTKALQQALKVGGITLAAGTAIEIGTVLIAGLSLSSLVPVPIGVIVAVSIGAALTDYYAIEPKRSREDLEKALQDYLRKAKQQFLMWFDKVEKYFAMRVEEIKKTM